MPTSGKLKARHPRAGGNDEPKIEEDKCKKNILGQMEFAVKLETP